MLFNKKKERDKKIEMEKSKAQRVHAFNQMFEQKGIENWKKNMISKKKMEEKDLEFQLKEAKKFQDVVYNAIHKSEREVIKQIENFEALLLDKENKEANEMLKYDNSKNMSTSLKVKELATKKVDQILEKIMKNPLSKKERDRRRRKIIVEQMKAQLEIENKRREEQLIKKLFKLSNQEKQLDFETYRVQMSKEIIKDNRSMREEMYKFYKNAMNESNIQNQHEFLNSHRKKLEITLHKEEKRRKTLSVSLKQNLRSKNTDYCKKLVDMIIDITDEAYNYQQINDVEEFDPRVWREWTQLFINNMNVKQELIKEENHYNKTKEIFLQDDNDDGQAFNNNNMGGGANFNVNIGGNNISQINNSHIDDMNNSLLPSANQTNFATGFAHVSTAIDKKLDESELYDYIHYLSQWNYNQIPSSNFFVINLNDLMQPEAVDDPKAKKDNNKKITANKKKMKMNLKKKMKVI